MDNFHFWLAVAATKCLFKDVAAVDAFGGPARRYAQQIAQSGSMAAFVIRLFYKTSTQG
ncbi:MAG: hypothetical protein ACJAVM_003457 [Sulfitobacter sp.]